MRAVGRVLEVVSGCHVFVPRLMIAVGTLVKGLHATSGRGTFLKGPSL